jgi:hypothetical protein
MTILAITVFFSRLAIGIIIHDSNLEASTLKSRLILHESAPGPDTALVVESSARRWDRAGLGTLWGFGNVWLRSGGTLA